MARDDAARALLEECGKVYATFTKEEDLATDQTVATYQDASAQRKYVHMYFAKQVALWRRIRSKVTHRDSAIWSVGAGPMLDLFGWFWDTPAGGSRVVACDALPWLPLRDATCWADLAASTVGAHDYRVGVAVPEPSLLPQCASLALKALDSKEVEDGATVLFPFMLNHLLGRNAPTGKSGREAFREWTEDILRRDGRLIIADMHAEWAAEFWSVLTKLLGVQADATDYNFFGGIGEIADLYPDVSGVRGRRGSTFMAKATVLVIDSSGAVFL